jgi:hypothetical protein
MSITDFFKTSFSVGRFTWSDESASESIVSSFYGHLQQANSELVEHLGLSFSTAFSIWCPITANVSIGDTLNDGSHTYSVKAINLRNFAGTQKHLELTVERDEDYVSV